MEDSRWRRGRKGGDRTFWLAVTDTYEDMSIKLIFVLAITFKIIIKLISWFYLKNLKSSILLVTYFKVLASDTKLSRILYGPIEKSQPYMLSWNTKFSSKTTGITCKKSTEGINIFVTCLGIQGSHEIIQSTKAVAKGVMYIRGPCLSIVSREEKQNWSSMYAK